MVTTPRCPDCGMPVTACKCSSGRSGNRFAPPRPGTPGMKHAPVKGPLKRAPKKQGSGKGRR